MEIAANKAKLALDVVGEWRLGLLQKKCYDCKLASLKVVYKMYVQI